MTTAEDILAHHGVKGMHWGVRRERGSSPSGPSPVATTIKPGHRVKTSGGTGHTPSEDAVRAAVAKQKAKKSSADSLSNKELQDLVNRMNLNQQYSRLSQHETTGARLKKGHNVVKEILLVGATVNTAIAFAASPAGKSIRTHLTHAKV